MMKPVIPLVATLLFASATSWAAPMPDSQASTTVQQMEDSGRPASEMVGMLVNDGRSVESATALAVSAGRYSETRVHAAIFGMCLASSSGEFSDDVGSAARQAAGSDDIAVANAVNRFRFDQCDQYTPYLRPASITEPRGPGLISPGSPSN